VGFDPQRIEREPLMAGLTVSQLGNLHHPGTIGCFVVDNQSGRIALLSNYHVLRFYEPSRLRSLVSVDAHEKLMIQPAGFDVPALKNWDGKDSGIRASIDDCVIAKWERGRLEDNLDAAIAILRPGVFWTNQTPDKIILRAPPEKSTSVTHGRVSAFGMCGGGRVYGRIVNCPVPVSKLPLKLPHEKQVQSDLGVLQREVKALESRVEIDVTDQYFVEPDALFNTGSAETQFQSPSDSGTVLINEFGQVIGLLHSVYKDSSSGIGYGVATPIERVLRDLNLSFPSHSSGVTPSDSSWVLPSKLF
jgi:hypothetical protein